MADSEQNIDWTAVRQAALKCLDATWDMVWWAERSQEDDYDVDGAALHLAAIDTAGDALTRAISMFEPGLFDSLALASVGEGPRPDFQVGDICLPTAHEMTFILLRHALFWVENGLAAQDINPIEQLHELSAKALHEKLRNLTAIKSLSLLTPQQFKGIGRFFHMGTLKPIESLLTLGQYNVVRAWIDREWAAVSKGAEGNGGAGSGRPAPKGEIMASELYELQQSQIKALSEAKWWALTIYNGCTSSFFGLRENRPPHRFADTIEKLLGFRYQDGNYPPEALENG